MAYVQIYRFIFGIHANHDKPLILYVEILSESSNMTHGMYNTRRKKRAGTPEEDIGWMSKRRTSDVMLRLTTKSTSE